jgi:hypothetical protein
MHFLPQHAIRPRNTCLQFMPWNPALRHRIAKYSRQAFQTFDIGAHIL